MNSVEDREILERIAVALECNNEIGRSMLEIFAAQAIREMETDNATRTAAKQTETKTYVQSPNGRDVAPFGESQEDS